MQENRNLAFSFARSFNLFSLRLCSEKAAHKGLDYDSFRRLFMVSGYPGGHEGLFRKDLMGCASLHPSYGSSGLFMVSGCPGGHEELFRKVLVGCADA